MYAVILSGGKQYRVQEGDTIKFEKLLADVGSSVNFDKILLVGEGDNLKIGKPFLDNCAVSGTVISQDRHKKIHIIKFRRRKHHEKWQGHRQYYTEVKIDQIKG